MFVLSIAPETEWPYHVHVGIDTKFSLSWSQDVTDVTSKRKRLLTISNDAGLEVTVDFNKLMTNCQIKHAWARTIHTFQVRAAVDGWLLVLIVLVHFVLCVTKCLVKAIEERSPLGLQFEGAGREDIEAGV